MSDQTDSAEPLDWQNPDFSVVPPKFDDSDKDPYARDWQLFVHKKLIPIWSTLTDEEKLRYAREADARARRIVNDACLRRLSR